MIIDKNPHICQIETIDGNDISLDTHVSVRITIISGEISLFYLRKEQNLLCIEVKRWGGGMLKKLRKFI